VADEAAQSQAATMADDEAPTGEPTQSHTTGAIAEVAASADVPAEGQTATAEGEAPVDRPTSQTSAGAEDHSAPADVPGAKVDSQDPSTATKDEAPAAEASGRVGEGQALQEAAEETNVSTAEGAATAPSEDTLHRVFDEKSAAAASLAAEESSHTTARTGQADQTAILYAALRVNHTEEVGTSAGVSPPPTKPGSGDDLQEAQVAPPAVTDAVSANEVPKGGSLKAQAEPSTAQKQGEANESNATEAGDSIPVESNWRSSVTTAQYMQRSDSLQRAANASMLSQTSASRAQASDGTGAASRSRDKAVEASPARSTSQQLQDPSLSSRGAEPTPRPSLRATRQSRESSATPEKADRLSETVAESRSDLTIRKSSLSRSETVAETSADQGGNQGAAGGSVTAATTSLRSGIREAEPQPSRRSAPATATASDLES